MNKTREYRLMLQKVKRDIASIVDLSLGNTGTDSRMMEWGVVILALMLAIRLIC
jgi:hypothetical protein